MKTRQENYMSMARVVTEILHRHEEEWKVLPKFVDCATRLKELLHSTDAAQTLAQKITIGITIDKNLAAEHAIDIGLKLSRRATVYALDTENHDLAHQLHIGRHHLLHGHQSMILHKLEEVRMHLIPILPFLQDYGVVDNDLELLEQAIMAYGDIIVQPRQTIVERKVHNNAASQNITAIRSVLHKMDHLINYFEPGSFAMEYHNARIVVDLGGRRVKKTVV